MRKRFWENNQELTFAKSFSVLPDKKYHIHSIFDNLPIIKNDWRSEGNSAMAHQQVK